VKEQIREDLRGYQRPVWPKARGHITSPIIQITRCGQASTLQYVQHPSPVLLSLLRDGYSVCVPVGKKREREKRERREINFSARVNNTNEAGLNINSRDSALYFIRSTALTSARYRYLSHDHSHLAGRGPSIAEGPITVPRGRPVARTRDCSGYEEREMIIDLSLWGCQITGLGARRVCVKEQIHGCIRRAISAYTHAIGDQAETVVRGLAAREMIPLRNASREMIRGMLHSLALRESRDAYTLTRDYAEFTELRGT